MRRRAAALIGLSSFCTLTAAPAFAYWSRPVAVEVTLRTSGVPAPTQLRIERDPAQTAGVTLFWQGPAADSVTGFQVERADLDDHGLLVGSSWSTLDLRVSCTETGACRAIDVGAPVSAAYRVTAETGHWRSDPSTTALLIGTASDLPQPTGSPTDPASGSVDTAPGPETSSPSEQPASTQGPTLASPDL